jgi:hypothetical protein
MSKKCFIRLFASARLRRIAFLAGPESGDAVPAHRTASTTSRRAGRAPLRRMGRRITA